MRNKSFFVLAALGLLAVLLSTTGANAAQPPSGGEPAQAVQQQAVQAQPRPDLPVRSIHLRGNLPDHPRGAAVSGHCDKDVDLTSTLAGVTAVAAQDNSICTSADLDTYKRGGSTYVVQAGGEEAAWTHTDVTDPASPVLLGQFVWSGQAGANTYTPDVKTFQQGANDYIVLALERQTFNAFCGVVIYNVNNPGSPVQESQSTGADWCDVHNVFVEDDASGDGGWIYLTADGPNDMRVLDIGGGSGSVAAPIEVGRYISPTASSNNYVHDITVVDHGGTTGRRVYLAYWDTGLVVLDAAQVTPGTNPTPIIGPNALDPAGFLNHHSFPTQDGNFVFIQDEFIGASGQPSTPGPVQMWDISNPAIPSFVDELRVTGANADTPTIPAHNLEIRYDIDPNRLYVGWYKLGLQAWDFTSSGFVRSNPSPRTAVLYHQAQTEPTDGEYSGAWGVRMENITTGAGTHLYIFQSDRNYGLVVDCVGCPAPAGMHVGDLDGSSASAPKGKWDATVEIAVHDDAHAPVSGATVSGSWSAGASGSANCTTNASGICSVQKTGNKNNVSSVTFTVNNVTKAGLSYNAGANHDPDGGSDGTVIVVPKPGDTGGDTGSIKGRVTDAGTGKGIKDATVTTDTGQSATTNKQGRYTINGVPAGSRDVTASASGYTPQTQTVTVTAGSTTSGVDFMLSP